MNLLETVGNILIGFGFGILAQYDSPIPFQRGYVYIIFGCGLIILSAIKRK